MTTLLEGVLGAFGQTKVVEDMFNQARDLETRGAKNKVVKPATLWDHLAKRMVLHEHHHFTKAPV
eukprot:5959213-Prorocentrum_lima.AAC.1